VEAPRRRAGLSLLVALALSSCGGSGDEPCRSGVRDGVLPSWARSGFSEAEPRVPHVVGAEGRIAGILFNGTLSDPPGPDRQNKILWVVREPGAAGTLRLTARQGDRVETRTVDLGPSTVDLPAGCWEVTLEWDDTSDSVSLVYE
jgi:hypothetical protein